MNAPHIPSPAVVDPLVVAVRTLRLARELLDGHTLVKLEVLGSDRGWASSIRGT